MSELNVAQLAFSLSNRAGGIFEILLGQSHALRNLGVGVQAIGLEDDLWSKDRERWGAVPASVFSVQGPRFFCYSAGFSQHWKKQIRICAICTRFGCIQESRWSDGVGKMADPTW